MNLADPTGWQNKVGARRGERGALPKWFQRIGYRMRLKQTVSKTRGTDANAQVVLVRPADHKTMISLYFAGSLGAGGSLCPEITIGPQRLVADRHSTP